MTPSSFDGLSMGVNDGDRLERQGFGDGVEFFGRLITLCHYLRTSVQRKWMDEGRRRSGLFYTCEKLS